MSPRTPLPDPTADDGTGRPLSLRERIQAAKTYTEALNLCREHHGSMCDPNTPREPMDWRRMAKLRAAMEAGWAPPSVTPGEMLWLLDCAAVCEEGL